MTKIPDLEFHPVTPDRWKDFEKLFGENGFPKIVDRVAAIERALGIYDLNRLTPRA